MDVLDQNELRSTCFTVTTQQNSAELRRGACLLASNDVGFHGAVKSVSSATGPQLSTWPRWPGAKECRSDIA